MANNDDHHRRDFETTSGGNPAAAMLDWYRAMGVDEAVGETPVDWLARGDVPPPAASTYVAHAIAPTPAREAASPAPPAVPAQPAVHSSNAPDRLQPARAGSAIVMTDAAAEEHARSAAAKAGSLDELRGLLETFDGCGLKATAKNMCFFRGAADARVVIIGEAPGRDEDRAGVPFVGRAGQLLDKMLAAIGLSEADTHITNVVYWRPPGNRVPTPQETLVCRPFLERQIQLVSPEIIVTVGGSAAKLVLNTPQGIMKVRGKWHAIDIERDGAPPAKINVMPTLHPAYLLRSPAHKRHAWRDLLAIRAVLDGKLEPGKQ